MIDLILYANDQYKKYTIEHAKAYVKASRILESSNLSEITEFIKESPNNYFLFIGGTTKLNSGVLASILATYDNEIKTFNLCDIHEAFFEPKEPCFSYFDYGLDLIRSRGPYLDNRGRMRVDYLNPVFAMTKQRFLSLGDLDDSIHEHFDLYFSFISNNNILDTDVTVATKVSPSVNEEALCLIGNRYVHGFKEAYRLLRGKEPSHLDIEPQANINMAPVEHTLDFYRLAYKYRGKSVSIMLTDKLTRALSDIVISVIPEIPAHYYVSARSSGSNWAETSANFASLIDNTNGIRQKVLGIKLASSPRDGYLFRDSFSHFDCIDTLALQVAGFMGFSEIQIYHEGDLKENADKVAAILHNSGIKIIRHKLC